jgi:hypothetical protein
LLRDVPGHASLLSRVLEPVFPQTHVSILNNNHKIIKKSKENELSFIKMERVHTNSSHELASSSIIPKLLKG